ncbi:MAG: hypothetical protein QOD66_2718, partial [Solirubrobacteraceae bacterium]|nr:hypothetical protein [Solirubrobacteraceae bacterium]
MAKTASGRAVRGNGGPPQGPSEEHGVDPALERVEQALRAAAGGDFQVRLPARRKDEIGRLEAAYNDLVARNAA